MSDVSILWLDDHWSKAETPPLELSNARKALEYEFAQAGMVPRIVCRQDNDEIWADLGTGKFDLLILDYGLAKDASQSNAIELLDRLERQLRSVPPVILFTSYELRELETAVQENSGNHILAVFHKHQSFEPFARYARQLLESRPLTFVVMSDLHVGYLEEKGGISQERFLDSLYSCLDTLREENENGVDGLMLCGDFAWRSQRPELNQTFRMLQQITVRLGIGSHEQVFFCPGNHDIDFSRGTPSWDAFGEFVRLLKTLDPGYLKRFGQRNPDAPGRQPFHDQTSLLSIVRNDRLGIVVVGLNSNLPTGDGHSVKGSIDEGQWGTFVTAMNDCPSGYLKIVLLHHPIFSAPGGVYEDDLALADQGKAMQILTGAGVHLVFHGHAHFSAVHAHRIAIVNGPQRQESESGGVVDNLVTVACPSLVADPSSASPHRQFLVVQLDRLDPRVGTRKFALRTKIFNPGNCSWLDGGSLSMGSFEVAM
jgi:Calcineurin-like phosphoesterase